MVACKMSIKKIFDRIKRVDKFKEFKTTYGLTLSDVKGGTKFAANFYKSAIVNYKGYVNGSKELYSEVIAEALVNDSFIKDWLNLIPVRPEHFKINHTNKDENVDALKITNRKEEILAKLLFYQGNIDGLGYIFDYQTPLKNEQSDPYGKIDLLSYNKKDNLISIVELKYRPSVSDETLLRCILEAYTYYKLLKLDQVKQKLNDENQQANLVDSQAELVILFDEGGFSKSDGGSEKNLMVSLDSSGNFEYPNKTIKTQQYKEIKGLGLLNENTQLYKLCKAILKQEEMLKQIRFLMLKRSGTQTANRLRDKDDNDSVEYYEYCTECLEIIKD